MERAQMAYERLQRKHEAGLQTAPLEEDPGGARLRDSHVEVMERVLRAYELRTEQFSELRRAAMAAAAPQHEEDGEKVSSDRYTSLPAWILWSLGDDAAHYAAEWHAHLWQLLQEGDRASARRDRRRMILGAPLFALRIRASRLARRRA